MKKKKKKFIYFLFSVTLPALLIVTIIRQQINALAVIKIV
jgi:hypothetical protein